MSGIEQRKAVSWYYGNPDGYIDRDTAVVDTMFQIDELNRWLSKNTCRLVGRTGIYEGSPAVIHRLLRRRHARHLKSCRIWQLKPGAAEWKDFVTFGSRCRSRR